MIKNPNNTVFSASHTLQKCDNCGYQNYAENFKNPLFAKCPKCNKIGEITIL